MNTSQAKVKTKELVPAICRATGGSMMFPLVHLQNRLSAKCYAGRHETTDLRASALGRRARVLGGGPALVRRLRPPSLPDPPRKLQGRERLPDCPLVGLRSPDGAQRREALQRGGPRRSAAQALFSTQEGTRCLRGGAGRAVGRDASSKSHGVRQGHEPVDAGAGRQGELRGGDYRGASERGDRASYSGADGGALVARQALDYQPRPRVREKTRRRDRLMRLAASDPQWAVGFEDETWWSRFALPSMHLSGARMASPRASCNSRSPKTTPTRRPSPATGSS